MSAEGLRIENVGKRFAGRSVIEDVSLAVEPGRALVLLGESGSGKTTLLRIVAGLETADEGRVRLDGRILSDPTPRVPPAVRRVGMVFQALELWPHLTVAEHLAFGLPGAPRGRRAARDARVLEVARGVGLGVDLLLRRPSTLSGGEQQRVAIARTIAAGPRVVLFDEPLASLDPSRRGALRDLICALGRSEERCLLHVTHDAEEAQALGQEIAVLDRGKIVERATPERLYATPRSAAGARALGAANLLRARREGRGVRTALGVLDLAPEEGVRIDAGLALVRPEAIELGAPDGAPARVEGLRARAPGFAVTLSVGEERVLAYAPTRCEPGSRVGVRVRAPAVLLPPEGGAA